MGRRPDLRFSRRVAATSTQSLDRPGTKPLTEQGERLRLSEDSP